MSVRKEKSTSVDMPLKLKLQYLGHLMRRADSLEKTLMLGKIEGWGRRGRQRMRWLDGITDSMGMSLSNAPDRGRGVCFVLKVFLSSLHLFLPMATYSSILAWRIPGTEEPGRLPSIQ